MSDYTPPATGFLVVCMTLGRHVIVPPDLERLALVIGKIHDEAQEKFPSVHSPIQCFELGRELSVSLKYALASIGPLKPTNND